MFHTIAEPSIPPVASSRPSALTLLLVGKRMSIKRDPGTGTAPPINGSPIA